MKDEIRRILDGDVIDLKELTEDPTDAHLRGDLKAMIYSLKDVGLKVKRRGVDPVLIEGAGGGSPSAIVACRVFSAGDIARAGVAQSAVPFDSVDFDDDGMWDADNPDRITLSRAGIWRISCNLRYEGVNYNSVSTVAFRKNIDASTIPDDLQGSIGQDMKCTFADAPLNHAVSFIDEFEAGDFVNIWTSLLSTPFQGDLPATILGRSNDFFWADDRYAPVFEAVWLGER